MELKGFIESHDKAIVAVQNIKSYFSDEGLDGMLPELDNIINHISLLEMDYIGLCDIILEEK